MLVELKICQQRLLTLLFATILIKMFGYIEASWTSPNCSPMGSSVAQSIYLLYYQCLQAGRLYAGGFDPELRQYVSRVPSPCGLTVVYLISKVDISPVLSGIDNKPTIN